MNQKTIVTISREFGSGGSEVGKKLAEALGIAYYNRELIEMAAQESGLDETLFEEVKPEKRGRSAFLDKLGASFSTPLGIMQDLSMHDRLFEIQSQVVADAANQGPCVIVGRSGDYVLRKRSDVLNVFIYAKMSDRIQRVMKQYGIEEEEAKAYLQRIDEGRRQYYDYYTNKQWGVMESYDICLNVSKLGIEGCAAVLKAYLMNQE